tara:strand:+ start:26915 stop:27850 length:936 start_codon:yes stop_codon:yes gene_type:complete
MKVLVIDSHKSSKPTPANNLHWINAKIIADRFGGDLIWSYPGVNDEIKSGYDVIIFVHASHYAFVDYAWLEASPDAKLFHVTNEYNLGEPRILWMAAKRAGRKYNVIANHEAKPSKLVGKYIDDWNIVNLNALCIKPVEDVQEKMIEQDLEGVFDKALYYGSFRKDRTKYFEKYFNSDSVVVSSHKKNHEKFHNIGANPEFITRINWSKNGLMQYQYSLYIEDEKTHTYYNFLANRFYEALNYQTIPLFDASCMNTLEKCGYNIGPEYVVNSPEELEEKLSSPPPFKKEWVEQALKEKETVLEEIDRIINS